MKNYRVVFEIETEAKSPLEAAKKVQEWLQESNNNWQFYVQEDDDSTILSIDLDEDESCAILNADNYMPLIKN